MGKAKRAHQSCLGLSVKGIDGHGLSSFAQPTQMTTVLQVSTARLS